MHQLLGLLQLDSRGVALHDVAHLLGVLLQAGHQLLVRRRHSAALQLRHLLLQAPRLVGQLTHHGVPQGKAVVAGLADREVALVAAGARVASRAGHALPAGALASGAVALRAGDSPGVAVTRWKRGTRSERRSKGLYNLSKNDYHCNLRSLESLFEREKPPKRSV